ncbi:MAG TPA: cytochrome bc complex cytochrome b subunit [Candidatus Kapabacteria bacterium]|nr:cytochrome bc complex cytochrome b subunit [Candidatus Kapabacteria bacterium]
MTNEKFHLVDALHLRHTIEALKEKHVPHHRASLWYYLGGLAILFFTIQVVTGVLLLFYYDPTTGGAYKSIERIMLNVPFGWLIRSLHSWSANALVLVVFIHMFSAFLMKAYRAPRRVMWLTGIVLLALLLGFGFTGYLLPWDETAYFATKIGTEVPTALPVVGELISGLIKGANDVNGSTLTRMFALHVGALPAIAILFVILHSGLIMLFGSSSPPEIKITGQTKYFPDYLLKELMLWVIGFGVIVAIAVLYPWGIGRAYDLANPTEPPAGIHPEWYFMFLFQTLKIIPEWIVIVGFGIIAVLWTVVPWLDRRAHQNKRSPIFTWIGVVAILYMTAMTTWAYVSVMQEQQDKPPVMQSSPTDSTHAK